MSKFVKQKHFKAFHNQSYYFYYCFFYFKIHNIINKIKLVIEQIKF